MLFTRDSAALVRAKTPAAFSDSSGEDAQGLGRGVRAVPPRDGTEGEELSQAPNEGATGVGVRRATMRVLGVGDESLEALGIVVTQMVLDLGPRGVGRYCLEDVEKADDDGLPGPEGASDGGEVIAPARRSEVSEPDRLTDNVARQAKGVDPADHGGAWSR